MALFNDKPTQLAFIAGKYVMSGACTDVIGGTMTAGAMTDSALLTFAPPFISAPTIQATIIAGVGGGGAVLTASNFLIAFTGVTVSNAYISTPASQASGCVVAIQAIGLARL